MYSFLYTGKRQILVRRRKKADKMVGVTFSAQSARPRAIISLPACEGIDSPQLAPYFVEVCQNPKLSTTEGVRSLPDTPSLKAWRCL